MPDVGFSTEPVRKDLKTAPPDGYVKLRRLPYNEILRRREMGTKLSMEQTTATRGKRQKQNETQKLDIELVQEATREFEFAHCIVDHNLTVAGADVDFKQPKLAFKMVAPEVLQEIELYITELNMETEDDELEDFPQLPEPSSSEETMLLENSTATAS